MMFDQIGMCFFSHLLQDGRIGNDPPYRVRVLLNGTAEVKSILPVLDIFRHCGPAAGKNDLAFFQSMENIAAGQSPIIGVTTGQDKYECRLRPSFRKEILIPAFRVVDILPVFFGEGLYKRSASRPGNARYE